MDSAASPVHGWLEATTAMALVAAPLHIIEECESKSVNLTNAPSMTFGQTILHIPCRPSRDLKKPCQICEAARERGECRQRGTAVHMPPLCVRLPRVTPMNMLLGCIVQYDVAICIPLSPSYHSLQTNRLLYDFQTRTLLLVDRTRLTPNNLTSKNARTIMAPKPKTPKTPWQKCKNDLARRCNEGGPRGIAGSGFEIATAAPSPTFKIVKYKRFRPAGHSVFSTLAMGLEVMENDRMGVVLTEEVVHWEAIALAEKSKAAKEVVTTAKSRGAQESVSEAMATQEKPKRAREVITVAKGLKTQGMVPKSVSKRKAGDQAAKRARKSKLKEGRRVVEDEDEDEAGVVSLRTVAETGVDVAEHDPHHEGDKGHLLTGDLAAGSPTGDEDEAEDKHIKIANRRAKTRAARDDGH